MKSMVLCMERMAKDGYTQDFQATAEGLRSLQTERIYSPAEVQVVNFFRFEGNSDPADNSIMYIIEARDGSKGMLVDAYGVYGDETINRFVQDVQNIEKKVVKE